MMGKICNRNELTYYEAASNAPINENYYDDISVWSDDDISLWSDDNEENNVFSFDENNSMRMQPDFDDDDYVIMQREHDEDDYVIMQREYDDITLKPDEDIMDSNLSHEKSASLEAFENLEKMINSEKK